MDSEKLYLRNIHPEDKKTLHNLTQNKHWDSVQSKKVLVSLAMLRPGNFIPAENAPESIHLQSWRPFIDDLVKRTSQSGREYSRAVLADTGKQSIIMSGKIIAGDEHTTRLELLKQPGREREQLHVGSMHTHPWVTTEGMAKLNLGSHGLSGTDYRTFLSDPEQQFMMIVYGEKNSMFAMKTSATPNNMRRERLEKRIAECELDYLNNGNASFMERVAFFNKAVCTEFGLTLYRATPETRDLFE